MLYYSPRSGKVSTQLPLPQLVKSKALEPWLIAAEADPGFCSMKWLGVLLLPLNEMLVHRRSLPQFVRLPQQFAGTHLYSWVERGTVRVECLAQEHNTVSLARTDKPKPLNSGMSTLTMRPLHLQTRGLPGSFCTITPSSFCSCGRQFNWLFITFHENTVKISTRRTW